MLVNPETGLEDLSSMIIYEFDQSEMEVCPLSGIGNFKFRISVLDNMEPTLIKGKGPYELQLTSEIPASYHAKKQAELLTTPTSPTRRTNSTINIFET